MPVAPRSSFLGFAKEATPGTGVAAATFVPFLPGSLAPHDIYNYVADESVSGSYVDTRDQIGTQAWAEFAYDAYAYVDTVGVPLKAILGAEATTGAGPYTHVYSLLNTGQPPSWSITDYNGFNARRFVYSLCNSLNLKFDATNLLQYTAGFLGYKSATVTTPTNAPSTVGPIASYTGAVSIGGTPTTLLDSADITIARNVEPVLAVNNSQNPTAIWGGGVSVTGSLVIIYTDDTFVTPYTGGTKQALDIVFGSGSASVQLHMTSCQFTDETLDRGGEYSKLNVSFEAVANTTDAGASGGIAPIKATVINSVSTSF